MKHYLLTTNRQTYAENRGHAADDEIESAVYGLILTDEQADVINVAVKKQFQLYLDTVGELSEQHRDKMTGEHTVGIGYLDMNTGWDTNWYADLTYEQALELINTWQLFT